MKTCSSKALTAERDVKGTLLHLLLFLNCRIAEERQKKFTANKEEKNKNVEKPTEAQLPNYKRQKLEAKEVKEEEKVYSVLVWRLKCHFNVKNQLKFCQETYQPVVAKYIPTFLNQ